MIRRLAFLAAVVLASSGCTVQQYLAFTTRTVNESPLTYNGQPTTDLAYYDRNTRTLHLDPKAIAAAEKNYAGLAEWVRWHESGHAIADDIGLTIGNEPYPTTPDTPWPPDERAAQCVAEVELGHGPPWTDDAFGYWDCSPVWVARTRALMAAHGISAP